MERTRSGRRGSRAWVIPPAIDRGPSETVDRLGILTEHGEEEGLLLWRIVRDVELWGSAPHEKRRELFTPTAPVNRARRLRKSTFPTDVRAGIRYLNRLLAGRADSSSPEEDVSAACAEIAEWAREIEAPETAVAFAQAAALTMSADARYALLTGTCAHELGQLTRAGTWFARATSLARRRKDWRTYATGFLALGQLSEYARTSDQARSHYVRAFRVARRHRGASDLRARAAYSLFRLARDAGDSAAAGGWAREATRAVMKAKAGGLDVLATLAEFWIESGRPERCARLLAYLRRIDAPPASEQFQVAVLRVRALTAMNDPVRAKAAWTDAWSRLEPTLRCGDIALLLHLARAAADLGDVVALSHAGRAALIRASCHEYSEVHSELLRIAGGRVEFGPAVPAAG